MCAGLVGSPHQIIGDGVVVVGETIELEPEHVGRNRGDLLDRSIAGCRQDVGDALALRLGGEQLLGSRPHQAGRAHRCHANRRVVTPSENLDVGRRLALNAVVRQQLDPVERIDVAIDAVFLVGAAIDEIEAEARNAPACPAAQIIHGGIELLQPRLAGTLDLLGRPSIDHRSSRRHGGTCRYLASFLLSYGRLGQSAGIAIKGLAITRVKHEPIKSA